MAERKRLGTVSLAEWLTNRMNQKVSTLFNVVNDNTIISMFTQMLSTTKFERFGRYDYICAPLKELNKPVMLIKLRANDWTMFSKKKSWLSGDF